MEEQKITSGNCPHCKTFLTFDDNDRKYGLSQCPTCKKLFLLETVISPSEGVIEHLEKIEEVVENPDIEISYDQRVAKNGRVLQYYCYITHIGLNKTKKVSAEYQSLLDIKVEEQIRLFNRKYKELLKLEKAKSTSLNAEKEIKEHQGLLTDSIKNIIRIDWEVYKKKDVYIPEEPLFTIPEATTKDSLPKKSFFENFFSGYREKRQALRDESLNQLKERLDEAKKTFEEEHMIWEKKKNDFLKKQEKWNDEIDKQRDSYIKGNKEGVETFYNYLLKASEYPPKFPENIEVEYKKDDKLLLVEYELPDIEDIPKYKGEKYNRTTGKTEKIELSESARNSLYDQVLYSIPIRTLHEVFQNDENKHIGSIAFNGFVETLDKATGNHRIIYIMSLYVKREDFEQINLSMIEPKACFKGFKGVASSQLSQLAPIPPIMTMSREDKRLREGREIMGNVDTTINVASMQWEDFEHLVREVFAKEFGSAGMEVKVTQSSRDLGVDAIAFDPDPVRGGKIIIQAKRYTNTVKVESVRALYGIMQDEGAMKGIIVTTSDYGPDAYKFAQGKPITLINGNNLLAMLEKYGHKAKIDLREAKRYFKSTK